MLPSSALFTVDSLPSACQAGSWMQKSNGLIKVEGRASPFIGNCLVKIENVFLEEIIDHQS